MKVSKAYRLRVKYNNIMNNIEKEIIILKKLKKINTDKWLKYNRKYFEGD